ncbi:hypothetical protein EDC96DRAFT_529011 [Choanephora cucurbitarum]|nr:hypothetical protein EDC96DRAFT_529011 [Choanephora cucurbitarum]
MQSKHAVATALLSLFLLLFPATAGKAVSVCTSFDLFSKKKREFILHDEKKERKEQNCTVAQRKFCVFSNR